MGGYIAILSLFVRSCSKIGVYMFHTLFSLPKGLARPGKEAGSGQVHPAAREPLPSLHTTTAAQVGREAAMDSRQSVVCPQWDREGRRGQLY